MSLVKNIKIACIMSDTNLSQLEKNCGFFHGDISRWDEIKPSYEKVVLVARELKCSVDSLVSNLEINKKGR